MESSLPSQSDLPLKRDRPSFLSQTWHHLSRYTILFERNLVTEFQDALLVICGSIAIVLLDNSLVLTKNIDPNIPNEYYVLSGVGKSPQQTAAFQQIALPLLFSHAIRGFMGILNFATKISLPLCVLTALSSTKMLTEKRSEFYRETTSGYDMNSYYLAINIFDAFKVSIKMIVTGLFVLFLRNTAVSVFATIIQFVLLGWLASSWGLIFPIFVPAENVILVTGFFSLFTSLLLAGAPSTPIEYEGMYDTPFLNILSSFLSPPRFLLESLAINEFKSTPEQHGFTVMFENTDFVNGFNAVGVGGGDADVYVGSKAGWYWGVAPAFFVGLFLRTLGFILVSILHLKYL